MLLGGKVKMLVVLNHFLGNNMKQNKIFYVYLIERITNLDIKPTPWQYIGSGTAHYSDLSEFAESRDFNKLCLNHTYIGSSKELKEDCKNGEKFKKTILRICETRQGAFDVETEFQHKHNACKDSSYYNRYIAGEHEEWNTAGLKRTEKQIEEIRKRSTGRKQSAEVIEKRASQIRGRKMSKAFCENLRQKNLGKKVSAETKEKLRIWNSGRKKKVITKCRSRLPGSLQLVLEGFINLDELSPKIR